MKKIKVLQFPISMNSGVKQYALNNWNFISKNRFQFDFALVRQNPALEHEIRSTGAGVRYILASADRDPERYAQEVYGVFEEGYDAIHIHTSFWKRLTIEELAVRYGLPQIIVHSHNTFVDVPEEDARQKALSLHVSLREQFNTSLATDFCACSNAAADWLFGENIPRDKIKIMKNAIDVDKYLFNPGIRTKVRKEFGLEGQFVLGHIGRFSFQKNHDFLIDMFLHVNQQLPKSKLLLIGEGPMEAEIKEKVERLGLTEQVIFAGQRQDVPALLQGIDVFCLPSRFEGLGIVLIEAQASGVRCVVSPYVPREGQITNLVTELPLDTALWSEQILHMARERPKRENMLEPMTCAGYNIREQIKEVENLYTP